MAVEAEPTSNLGATAAFRDQQQSIQALHVVRVAYLNFCLAEGGANGFGAAWNGVVDVAS